MTFEELKIRIQENNNVVLKCSPSFVMNMFNLREPIQSSNSIIIVAEIGYSDNYNQNHVKIQGDVIGGYIFYYPKFNPNIPSTESDYICNEHGNGLRGHATMMVFNDEDCKDIEVLNLCEGTDCGLIVD